MMNKRQVIGMIRRLRFESEMIQQIYGVQGNVYDKHKENCMCECITKIDALVDVLEGDLPEDLKTWWDGI